MSPLKVQFAVACLNRLQERAQTEKEIAASAGIPFRECADITARFERAGILVRQTGGALALADERCTSLKVLEALWGEDPPTPYKPLYGSTKGSSRLIRQWLKRSLLALIVMVGFIGSAQAVNPDTLVISVTPSVTYSVSIASPMVQGYQFGTVALGATTISTVAITLTNNGNVAEYFAMAVSNSSPNTWTPQAAAGADQFNLQAYLNATQPASGTFVDNLTTGVPGAGATLYGQASTKTNALGTKNLWLKLTMPTSITGSAVAQTMTLTINGQGS